MKENTKPQWLLDAEEEIEKFHQTEIGSLDEKAFRRKTTSQMWGGKGFNDEGRRKGRITLAEKGVFHTEEWKTKVGKGGKTGSQTTNKMQVTCDVCGTFTSTPGAIGRHRKRCYRLHNEPQEPKINLNELIVSCPHCNVKPGKRCIMMRWHFNNCKHKKD